MMRWKVLGAILLLLLLVVACSATVETVPIEVNSAGWRMRELLSVPSAAVYEIGAVGDQELPAYRNCANENDLKQPSYECALDLLFVPSPDYTRPTAARFVEHLQVIIRDVFGAGNALNRPGLYADPFRPFRFYVTDYRYETNTPQPGKCHPGLPPEWAPAEQNLGDVDLPAFDCNLALSTAGVELNLGLIIHQQPVPDRSRFNLFSSDYNSYAAVLHELSHAAFVMSDEAPSPDNSGRFQPKHYPNVYANVLRQACEAVCGTSCVEIKQWTSTVGEASAPSGFFRCQPPAPIDTANLMYFYPQPAPGDNATWMEYRYQYASTDRLQYIYEKCNNAQC
jgi:hypothetical protein